MKHPIEQYQRVLDKISHDFIRMPQMNKLYNSSLKEIGKAHFNTSDRQSLQVDCLASHVCSVTASKIPEILNVNTHQNVETKENCTSSVNSFPTSFS